MTRPLPLIGFMCLPACNAPETAGTGDTSYLPDGYGGEAFLTWGEDPVVQGGATVSEYEVASGADCIAGVVIDSTSSSGICIYSPTFTGREVGAASRILTEGANRGVNLGWNASNSATNCGELTYNWTGTLTVREWTVDRVEFGLSDGTRCDYPADTNCEPSADGVLAFVGTRAQVDAVAPAEDTPAYADVASGAMLCAGTPW